MHNIDHDEKTCRHIRQMLDIIVRLDLTIHNGAYAASSARVECQKCGIEFDLSDYWRSSLSIEEAERMAHGDNHV